MDSIGDTLRLEREKRGLSVQEAHDATKIAIQSITALEEDRFESFPNRVYARAFLRDYSNFLGLDSAELLEAYEEKWNPSVDADATAKRPGGSAWRAIGYSLLVVLILAALAAGGYYALYNVRHKHAASHESAASRANAPKPDVATIPKAQPVTPPKAEPVVNPKPADVAPPVAPDKVKLEVTALRDVWVQIKTDDTTAFMGIIPNGQTKAFEGLKSVYIKSGMAGAVHLKLNGQAQPPLGSLKVRGEKTFTLPAPPTNSAPPTGATAPPAATTAAPH